MVLWMSFFYVIENYFVMFLLHKIAIKKLKKEGFLMNCKKNAKSRSDDEHRLFDPAVEKVVEIGLERLRPFENHPFKVKEDEAMARLMESIER